MNAWERLLFFLTISCSCWKELHAPRPVLAAFWGRSGLPGAGVSMDHCSDNKKNSLAAGARGSAQQTVFCPQEENTPSTPDRLFKIVFVGDSAVGKTSFLRRICEARFSPGMAATVGEFSPQGGDKG